MALRVAGMGVAGQMGEDFWESHHLVGPLLLSSDLLWRRAQAELAPGAVMGTRGDGSWPEVGGQGRGM